jgi:alpha-D-xyloside xylohydrolase
MLIDKRVGNYTGQINHRIFNIQIIGINKEIIAQKASYEGNELTIKF